MSNQVKTGALEVAEKAWKVMEGYMGLRAMQEARQLETMPQDQLDEAELLAPLGNWRWREADEDFAYSALAIAGIEEVDPFACFDGFTHKQAIEARQKRAAYAQHIHDQFEAGDRVGKSMLLAEATRKAAEKAISMGEIYALCNIVIKFDLETEDLVEAGFLRGKLSPCLDFCDRALEKAEIRVRKHQQGLLALWELSDCVAKVSEFVQASPRNLVTIRGRRGPRPGKRGADVNAENRLAHPW